MGVTQYKPTSAGRRLMSVDDFSDLTTDKPYRPLLEYVHSQRGHNNQGRITSRHRGGGHKRLYRIIDFKRRDKEGIEGVVETIEYDPNRNVRIALVRYADGERRYVLAPSLLRKDHKIMAGPQAEIRPGNAMELGRVPMGTLVHNIEIKIGKGGQMVRAAGGSAQVMGREDDYVQIKLPSGELRKIHGACYATIGQLSNLDYENVRVGKAGRTRYLSWRPVVRGVAKNPVDHPMGGGQGKTKGGRHPCSPEGLLAKGLKTRRNKRTSAFIISRRTK